MNIELPGGKTLNTDSDFFKKLPQEQQDLLIKDQEKLIARRKAKAEASRKCRAKQKGLPWPPQEEATAQ